jgi:hypothetical protein
MFLEGFVRSIYAVKCFIDGVNYRFFFSLLAISYESSCNKEERDNYEDIKVASTVT